MKLLREESERMTMRTVGRAGLGARVPPGLGRRLLPGLGRRLLPGLSRRLLPGLSRRLLPGLSRRLLPGLSAGLAAGIALGACGGGGGSSGFAPGHGSPQGVVAAFIHAVTSGDLQTFCPYEPPSLQGSCVSSVKSIPPHSVTLTGAAVGNDVVEGNRALVTLIAGKYCTGGSAGCRSNHDPNGGLPHGSETFAQAWKSAQSSSSVSTDPALPIERLHGKWYAAAGG